MRFSKLLRLKAIREAKSIPLDWATVEEEPYPQQPYAMRVTTSDGSKSIVIATKNKTRLVYLIVSFVRSLFGIH